MRLTEKEVSKIQRARRLMDEAKMSYIRRLHTSAATKHKEHSEANYDTGREAVAKFIAADERLCLLLMLNICPTLE